ncbi:hypothetical protein EVG20_g4599 [Dentipellis fragilis]|uniref:O-methylsterigmatocystin oxidoreductase n=1 Tax=Dentipellis fragilis TaxID=205917 RepID=A0A4Y9YXS5_9AGAM|nr:hypothetical protein EVG20_g4599 [Dentipellis fragilis]
MLYKRCTTRLPDNELQELIMISLASFAVAIILFYLLWRRALGHKSSLPLPPGPVGLPLIGNTLDMPITQEWKTFSLWGDKYGPIMHISLLGQHIIILDTLKAASALLDGKSNIYSDRPVFQMASETMGLKLALVLAPYGPRMREFRRLMHRLFGTHATLQPYHESIEVETSRFLVRLLDAPEHFREHVRLTAGSIALKLSHGYNVQDKDDPFVRLADRGVESFSLATRPGAFLVDLFPILRFVPHWFPGTAWKQKAKEWTALTNDLEKGTALPSFTLTHLLDGVENVNVQRLIDIKWAASGIFIGGADTTVSAGVSFFLAMMLYPDVQRKAQAELDAVVGFDRLPCLVDRPRLRYIEVLIKEVLRWNPVAPLGGPHRVMEDDVYNGYRIPKGSTVIANIWKMLHDEGTYKDPMTFKPERFVDTPEKPAEYDPRGIAFGFGRRICPGITLAEASLFTTLAMVLSVFDISAPHGDTMPRIPEYSDGTVSHPPTFKCNIIPRTEAAAALVKAIREN